MGVVLGARHLVLGQRVAIKCMQSEGVNNPNAVSRFLREARAAGALSNEHVTRVLDVGQLESGEPYMVMEYLEGADFDQLLHQRGPLPVVEAVSVILQACEGIAEAHAIGIVHRDLKPANLFLSNQRDGSTLVKVLDFGISKATEFGAGTPGENLTSTGLVMGSPAYMSPEQMLSSSDVDARSDVWSMGTVLYELVTGAHPFRGHSELHLFANVMTKPPLPVRAHVQGDEVPPAAEAILLKCLRRPREDRFESMKALAEALRTASA